MRTRDVEKLAEASRLYVNLYVRNSDEWEKKDAGHLSGLVQRSFSMGTRADAFFRSANLKYDDIISNKIDSFSKFVELAQRRQPLEYGKIQAMTRGDERRIIQNMAIWFAYLNALSPALCEDIDDRIEQFGLPDVFWRLQLRKFLYASRISGAAGGQFYIDPTTIEEFARRPEETDRLAMSEAKFRDRDYEAVTAFVTRQLTALDRTELFSYELADEQFRKLERFLESCEEDQVKAKINDAIAVICDALKNGEISTTGFSDLGRYYNEQVRRVEENKLGQVAGKVADIGTHGTIGGFVLEPLLTSLGFAVPSALLAGIAVGGLTGLFAGGQVKQLLSGEKVLSKLYPTAFKLHEIRKLSRSLGH